MIDQSPDPPVRFRGQNATRALRREARLGRAAAPLLLVGILHASPAALQSLFTVEELAQYRLREPVFQRFGHASRLIAAAIGRDPALRATPLFTREVAVLDDAPAAATALAARLEREPAFAAALRTASISVSDYTRFALGLFAARMAHGFLASGAMRLVPPGVASENVAFVEAHQAEIAALLELFGLEGHDRTG